ncbi:MULTISPECIES: DUF2569 domain-containing protein [unclassified Lysobacter]|uniref:DUF2569 domain-containing protein n=1 Tax=unclassified Lysobacter TaxID=2635362 RepID=UPI001C2343BA|nr:DUF2569 domain-containing protein [Lysobacter sp. MMG2]MBU8977261.1 DUF2569 domain-containing protein [Lysobacter sp. MMG2]
MSDNPYQAPQSSRGGLTLGEQPLVFAQTPQQRNAGPTGLGGWLIVIAIKLVMSVIVNFMVLRTQHIPAFSNGVWEQITTPGSGLYDPLLGPVFLYEAIGNGVFLAASLALLAMYFMKTPSFPRWMIVLLVGNVAFLGLDVYLTMQIPHLRDGAMGGVRQVIGACVAVLIWVPYLLVSKRVRNTFGRTPPPVPRREPHWETRADEPATP